MKILKSGQWKLKVLLVLVGITLSFLGSSPEELFSFFQHKQIYCSHNATASPYCNFSVVHTLEGHPTVSAIVISPDGKTLVSGGQDKAIKVWDLQTGKLKKTLQSNSGVINALAIAPDGKTVVSGSGDRLIRIWDITSERPPQILKGHSGNVTHVDFSSDGKTLISLEDSRSPEIKVWELATGEQKATLPYSHFHDISPDGKRVIFSLPNSNLMAWEVATNQQKVIQENFNIPSFARISLDEQTLVSIKQDNIRRGRKRSFYLHLSDLTTGKTKVKERFSSRIFKPLDIAITRDVLVGNTPKGLAVWNLKTAKLEAVLDKEKMKDLVVSPDGKLLAGITKNSDNRNLKIRVLRRP